MQSLFLTSGMLTVCSPRFNIVLAVHYRTLLVVCCCICRLSTHLSVRHACFCLLNQEPAQTQDLECLLLSCMATLLVSGLQGTNNVHMIDKHFWGPLGTAEAQQRKSAVSISTAWSCSGTGHKATGPASRVHICLGPTHGWSHLGAGSYDPHVNAPRDRSSLPNSASQYH